VSTLAPSAAKITTVAPGLVGIGLGRNPSGATQDMGEGVAPLRRDRVVLASMFGAMALWYALRLLDVIANWPFVVLLALTFVVAGAVATARARSAEQVAAAVEPEPELEWVGVTAPWTPERVEALDRALALDQVKVRAQA
jgi:branched-chain amino acid transport system permease protein